MISKHFEEILKIILDDFSKGETETLKKLIKDLAAIFGVEKCLKISEFSVNFLKSLKEIPTQDESNFSTLNFSTESEKSQELSGISESMIDNTLDRAMVTSTVESETSKEQIEVEPIQIEN